MKPTIINRYSYLVHDGYHFTEPSQTIEDQAFTPIEILQKFTRGLQLDIVGNPEYDDTDDYDTINPQDVNLLEIDERDSLRNQIEERRRATNPAKEKKSKEATSEAESAPDVNDEPDDGPTE